MKKRILSIMLSLALCLSLLPAVSLTALAEDAGNDPVMANNLTYTGAEQELVLVESGESIEYALGEDAEKKPGKGNWSADIPKGKDAGTYYVWYKAGNGDADCEEVIIYKAFLDVSAKNCLLKTGDDAPDLTAAEAYEITGFMNGDTADVIIGNPILSYFELEDPNELDMSQESEYTIYVDINDMSAANYDFNPIHGTLKVVECIHDFENLTVGKTIVQGDTILATCKNGCEAYKTPAPIVTIIAPEDLVYVCGLVHTVSIMFDSQVELSSEDIKYYNSKGEEIYDPVDAGTYTASITYQNGDESATARVNYTVAPRQLTIKADDKSAYVGSNAPEYTFTVTGWDEYHNEYDDYIDGVTAICNDADFTKTGEYAITLLGKPVVIDPESGLDVTSNYNITVSDEPGILTVRSIGTAELENLLDQLTPVARSVKTANKNIKVTLKLDETDQAIIDQIEDAGCTVKYNFYRSFKKSSKYSSRLIKDEPVYTQTGGTKGKMYYYKARIQVYDADGKLIARTELKQCRYANREWTK